MNRKHRTRSAESYRKLKQRMQKQRRLFGESVRFIKPLPSFVQLHQETCAYRGTNSVRVNQVIAYARHTYTNYDTLCKRLRTVGFLAREICDGYHNQANNLIYQTLRQEQKEA